MLPNNFNDFLNEKNIDALWPESLKALWHDAKGDWESSHNIAQDLQSEMGSWIHAYLHRKEGDQWNAGYWYRMANRPFPKHSLEEELKELVVFVLEK